MTRSVIDRYPRLLRIGVPVAVLTFAFFISLSVSRHDAVHETATFAIRSTDILRPFVGEKRYVSLLSSYYQIHTAQDFYAFYDLLQQEAKANNVRLPNFKPL